VSRTTARPTSLRFVLDDATVDLLRDAADARDIDLELLMVWLLAAAAQRIDELLGEVSEES